MRITETTECSFGVEAGWTDHTAYDFKDGDVQVVIGRFAPADDWRRRVEEALERFRTAVPAYELVERGPYACPIDDAEIVAHRVGGAVPLFEVSLFWPIEATTWVFRARGPVATEPDCMRALTCFAETYEPSEGHDDDVDD